MAVEPVKDLRGLGNPGNLRDRPVATGLDAARPAANAQKPDSFYYAYDTDTLYYTNGVSWSAGSGGYGTALPGSPVDGQEFTLVDSLTAAVFFWRLRYNAGSASTKKWEFVGGAPLLARDNSALATNSSSAWTAMSPSITVPRTGDYQVDGGFHGSFSAAGAGTIYGGCMVNGPPTVIHAEISSSAAFTAPLTYLPIAYTLTAGDLLQLTYFSNQVFNVTEKALRLIPVRIA